jgi:hypothetical protein
MGSESGNWECIGMIHSNLNIGIVILATNIYFALGIRFIKKFIHYYNGNSNITFYFFSDTNPHHYLPDTIDIIYFNQIDTSWVEATNKKFTSILSIGNILKSDYLFYFDADTDVNIEFDETWFLGETVGGQHFGDQSWMKYQKAYDRNEKYNAYIPINTELPEMYYLGAFFGGRSEKCLKICKILRNWQLEDQNRGFEPAVNDESYLNKYFHYNPPSKVILIQDFKFNISTKGGIKNYRNSSTDIIDLKNKLREYQNEIIDICDGNVIKFVY